MAEGGLTVEDVDAINMHATATPLGDVAESRAVQTVFGARARKITCTSTKSMTGHMLGAAGAAEAIASVLSIVHGVVPPTINVTELDPDCDLCYAIGKPVITRSPCRPEQRLRLRRPQHLGSLQSRDSSPD